MQGESRDEGNDHDKDLEFTVGCGQILCKGGRGRASGFERITLTWRADFVWARTEAGGPIVTRVLE